MLSQSRNHNSVALSDLSSQLAISDQAIFLVRNRRATPSFCDQSIDRSFLWIRKSVVRLGFIHKPTILIQDTKASGQNCFPIAEGQHAKDLQADLIQPASYQHIKREA